MESKVLKGDDVLFVKKTNLVREYQSETEGFKGKKYRVYAFGDKAFAVHEDDDFHEDLKSGEVAELMITVNDEGQWSLANHVTWTRKNALKRKTCENDSITVENYKPASVKEYAELG